MKKLISKKSICSLCVIAFLAIGASGIFSIAKNTAYSELSMNNVEALAQGEVIIGPWYCMGNDPGCHILEEDGQVLDGDKGYF